ncbi:MAG: lipopolysaccharide heptosyltransferase II [Endomicrobiia bacterium]|nr:lipopolysaccharide heptosyltransferase II [Endomicrobiia bacterium]
MNPQKILIIKPSGIGDIVHAAPVAKALKIIYPDAEIHWVVFTRFAGIMRCVGGIDGLIKWDRNGGLKEYFRVLGEIRRRRYDLSIDLQGLLRTAFLNRFSGATKKLATPLLREFSWLVERPVEKYDPRLHAVERNYRVAEFIASLEGKQIPPPSAMVPWLKVPDREKGIAAAALAGARAPVAFAVASRGLHKVWPSENFAELINRLSVPEGSDGSISITPVLIGSENERELARTVVTKLKHRAVNLVGEISLAELPAVLERCRLVVGNDSGVIHIAAALGVPVIGIFGATDPVWYRPYNDKSRYIYKKYPCSPCDIKTSCRDYKCMKDIGVDEVMSAVREMLTESKNT